MNELATTSNLPTSVPQSSWGAEQASSKDMLIPRIMLMQDLSDAVKSGKCRPGAIIDGTTNKVLVDSVGKKFEIIPILTYGEWLCYDVLVRNNKEEVTYKNKVVCDKSNENWSPEEVVAGGLVRRVRQINFLVLRPENIHELPYMVSFKKTSMRAGKKLSTHFQVSAMKGLPAAKQVFTLSSIQLTSKGFTYYGFEVEPARASTPDELRYAYHWYQMFNKGAAKVEDEQADADPFKEA